MTIKLSDVNSAIVTANASLATVNAALPLLLAAYNGLKSIWMNANPGKIEADYLFYLESASQLNIDDTARVLMADGFTQDAAGNWIKLPPPAA